MSLENVLRKAVKTIESGMLDNEAQVKQAVILPILRELGYDDTNPEQFVPEFSVGGRRVDYAIKHRGKPLVFIEAKRLGNLTGGGEEPDAVAHSPVSTLVRQERANVEVLQVRRARIVGFVFDGEKYTLRSGIQTLIKILNVFQERDANFMERFAPQTVGITRRLVARNREDLYKHAHLVEYSTPLENGWWLGTNCSTSKIKDYIRTACKVAKVAFGRQLRLIERSS